MQRLNLSNLYSGFFSSTLALHSKGELTGETSSFFAFTWVVPVFIRGNVMLGSFLLKSDSWIIKILQDEELIIIVTVKSNVKVGVNWNKFFKKIEEK